MMSTINLRACATLLLAMTTGCTIAYKDEVFDGKLPKQCSQTSECRTLVSADEADRVLCEAHRCVVAECLVDAQCPSMMCNQESHTCIEVEAGAAPPAKACKQDADCNTKAGELCSPKDGHCYEKWGCLASDPDWTDPENLKTAFQYKALFRSLLQPDDATLLRNITARACSSSDPTCERPFVPASAAKVTADGHLTLPFTGVGAAGWAGTIRVSADLPPSTDPNPASVLPGYIQFTYQNPLVTDMTQQARAILIDTGTADVFAQLAMVSDVTKVANIVFFIYDCGGNPAANVTVGIAGSDQGRFVPLVSESTPDLTSSTTSAFGAAFLIAAPKGFQTFVITDVQQTKTVTNNLAFNVFNDGINYLHYYPRFSAVKKWLDYAKANPSKVP